MIPLKWVMVLMAAGTLMMPVSSNASSIDAPPDCDWFTLSASACVRSLSCQESGDVMYIWENCLVGEELITITDSAVFIAPDCEYTSGKSAVTLKQKLDAENPPDIGCDVTGRKKIFFSPLDINEFDPYPTNGSVPVIEVRIKEEDPPRVIMEVYYTDGDYGETKDLTCEQIPNDYEDIFSLTPVSEADTSNKIKTFKFLVNKKLDFESQVFYKVEYNIISTDEKNNIKTAKQTFFVSLIDIPDNKPFFTSIEPVYDLEECQTKDYLFQVIAQDRDVDINYDIKYSMLEDPVGYYFKINKTTGEVSRNETIDREELLEKGISSFSLTITATEYKEDGTPGETPNNNQQVTIITIQDCNNKEPSFDQSSYAITMDELTDKSKDKTLDLEIIVKDMDKGNNGSYKLITSDPKLLSITPDKGMQSQDFALIAHWQDGGNNYFNYEVHGGTPLNFNITATENEDPSHNCVATVSITLVDVNDNSPVFLFSTYEKDVKESESIGFPLLTVEADDSDVRDEFGKPSISYSLEFSCYQFEIDNTTGLVTLAPPGLDYESENTENEIRCEVTARDSFGTGLFGSSTIIISVIDVVDEPPRIEGNDIAMDIEENSLKESDVGYFIVKDADNKASINFTIVSSLCSGAASTPNDVDGWFTVVPGTPNNHEHPANVKVNGDIDREQCSEVTLIIMAVDVNTEKNGDNDNGTVIITIKDVKDEAPVFMGEYNDLSMNEFSAQEPPEDSVIVFLVTVSDPDEGDTIKLSISEGGNLMELSETEVTVEAGDEAEVQVRTKKNAMIDRETDENIKVVIQLTNAGKQTPTEKKFTIQIKDLNDNVPIMAPNLCELKNPIKVQEDNGSMSMNGTLVYTIKATDADIESPYNSVSYLMMNDQIPDSKNLRIPFTVNETTGDVTVLLIENKTLLDRETDASWELFFLAYDQCRYPEDIMSCKTQQSDPCQVIIEVEDVNDNSPRDLEWTPKKPIVVTDFLSKNDKLNYTLRAYDDDEGINSTLTYEVIGTFFPPSDENMDLFYAVDEDSIDSTVCSLYAKQNFQGMNLTGVYNVVVMVKDGGNKSEEFNVAVTVEDANDQVPYFKFKGCPGEEDNFIIRMAENAYKPGEGSNPTPMEVMCSKPGGTPFKIEVNDEDVDFVNREVRVEIDFVNSTVENAVNEQEQLKYWKLDPPECINGCNLYLSHLIDREKGTAYNLALHAKNEASPRQESWSTVRIVITNIYEYDPYFCQDGDCSQIVYMRENDPTADAYIMEARDEDNINATPDDDQYNKMFYFIKGGDVKYFRIDNDMERKIVLKDMPEGLDRERNETFTLEIYVTNDPTGGDYNINKKNSTLHFTIRVQDVNDEAPDFPDEIFTSFMSTDNDKDRVTTIEAIDKDLNETLTYTIMNDLQWFDNDFTPSKSFTLERKDERSVYLILDFDPKGMTQGYCNFTIVAEDNGAKHKDKTQVKVYIINEDYQVAMYFTNTVEDVTSKQTEITSAFTEAYMFACVIDSITATQLSTGELVPNQTTIYMHFIDTVKNEPVKDKTILDLSDNADRMKQLERSLEDFEIYLHSVGTFLPPDSDNSPEDMILMLKILLAVVSLITGSLLVLLTIVYCIRTRSLTRKVKVLSTNTFGSKESGLNQMGNDMVSVPGSNFAKVHGNQNPVFNEIGAVEYRNRDTGSISSGDSVLVGVEDNPEFKSFPGKGGAVNSSSNTYDNPAFARSIDEVSAPPPGVQGGMKGNPLLNLGGLQDVAEPTTNPMKHYRTFEEAEGSESDTASLDQKIHSNFTLS